MTLKDIKHQFVEGNPRISFKELGNGPPVIFLHGIGGNHSNWYDQQSHISDRFTTIAWDARGYGDSEDYSGPLKFSDFGEDLIRLLDSRDIEKAHFVGLSMGARILMDFFPKYKNRVATLVLCDCFFDYKILSMDKQKEFIDLRQKPLKSGKTLEEIAPKLIDSLVGPNCTKEARDKLYKSFLKIHINSYLKTIAETVNYDASSNLSKFNVPTQLIYGEYDQLTPVAIGKSAQKKILNSSLNIIKNAGHLSNIEQPDAFNTIINNFLSKHRNLAKFKKDIRK
ncbi:MAG TPA: alpha/beta hydrolase [Alphaproteobacteria bacterium]|jgi:3-oxoadipate enol-lactonase|nr:alpha/beta hydrolase [Alphaproteobacteria bacterium]